MQVLDSGIMSLHLALVYLIFFSGAWQISSLVFDLNANTFLFKVSQFFAFPRAEGKRHKVKKKMFKDLHYMIVLKYRYGEWYSK